MEKKYAKMWESEQDWAARRQARRRLFSGLTTPVPELLQPFRHADLASGSDPNLRFAPPDPPKWFADMAGEFGRETWIGTNLVRTNAQGELNLIAELRSPLAPVLVLTTNADGEPFDVVAAGRYDALGSGLGLQAADWLTRKRLFQSKGVLLVVQDLAQAIALRQLGLAAAPVGDLAQCSKKSRRRLVERLNNLDDINLSKVNEDHAVHTSTDDGYPEVVGDCVLVIPAFDPLTLDVLPVEEGRPLFELLSKIERAADGDFGGLGVWLPTEDAIRRIRKVAKSSREENLTDAFLRSFCRDVHAADAVFAGAAGALAGGQSESMAGRTPDLVVASDALSASPDEDLSLALQHAGRNAGDPVAQALYDDLAHLQDISQRLRAGGARRDAAGSEALRIMTHRLKTIEALDRRLPGKSRRRRR